LDPTRCRAQCGDDDRQFQGLGRFGQRDHVVLQLARRIVANPGHQADLVVDEDERGVFRCKRLIGADWVGHDILQNVSIREQIAAKYGALLVTSPASPFS